MNIILNSKFFPELTPSELGQKLKAFGYDGVDPCVRPGHPYTLDDVDKTLPEAVRIWADQDFVCPMASAPVDFTDPTSAEAKRFYSACEEADVRLIKIGYWYYEEGEAYWPAIDRARKELEGFARLSEQHGVKTLCHTHSGPVLGSNCAGLMHLLDGFDPAHVGAYIDFGHMALDGEDLAMGLAIVADYLATAGIKDGFHAPQPGKTPPYRPQFAALGAGSVDWHRALSLLAGMNFEGPLCVHTEYEFDETIIRQVGYADTKPAGLEEVAQKDVAFLRGILAKVAG